MNEKNIIVIGSGFSGLSAATSLANQGYNVTVLEKNSTPGGRARSFTAQGFTFDMGPSWYWMPDVFESYFRKFGKSTAAYYDLVRLDPSYTVVFGEDDFVDVPASLDELKALFEKWEPGSAHQLDRFLEQAAYKYEVGINQLVYKPGRSVTEFINLRLLLDVLRLDVFQSFHKHIRRFFSHPKIIKLMEFPILFLGALPENTPALYSLMNYADISLGTWYPMGGMHKIIEGMVQLAEEKGVTFKYNQDVQKIIVEHSEAKTIVTSTDVFEAEVIVASADYHHVEKNLLPAQYQSYSDEYWNTRVMAPSSLIFYLGISKRLKKLHHHNLFFDEDFGPHANEIYTNPAWPTKPLFYVSAPSVTDPTVAPEGCENLFILIPVAPGLKDTEEVREKYYNLVMDRLEKLTNQEIRPFVSYKRSYAHNDFIQDYNAFKGNAYGLANTLLQTALLKPSLKSKKVKNLFYTGQLTVPGPGVPPSLISGQVVANEVAKEFKAPVIV
ncbi:phytoene desaturase [Pontibacter sp. BT310]|uniref:Phytoene desaturase n=1 Tax=Pontibacter populi TaxID=890055 RepID=A0ABS6XE47_9BACT|nr:MULTISPECIES: phytoene desaturase family protein [Pontibacter]MBJ6118552.1 phytoene desaturase [Pontibacter sp. BT310]MBR0570981.1 phytoene desaturase [Microvirga sp. STS03]MBW3365406.1 phytoene desaturase [Pontibacter populi]